MDTSLFLGKKQKLALKIAVFGGLFLRILLPWYSHGFRYMDEHWQVIEPANYLLHSVWSPTIEWREGLRSWFYPWLISRPMLLAELIEIKDPVWIISFTRMVHGIFAAISIPLVYAAVVKHSKNIAENEKSVRNATIAALLTAFWPFSIYAGIHTHGEMTGAIALLLGYFFVPNWALTGAFFGMAAMLKIDNAVAGLGLGLALILFCRWKEVLAFSAGVLPFAFFIGLIDKLTWGYWFHSVLGHAKVNLVEGVGNQWGTSPWYTHFLYWLDMTTIVSLLAISVAGRMIWRYMQNRERNKKYEDTILFWFTIIFFIFIFSLIPHKEKRFISPILYLTFALGAVSIATLREININSTLRKVVVALAIIGTTLHFGFGLSHDIIRRPWWDRIQALQTAGRIPGVEAVFTQQWPAPFYFPRNVRSELVEGTPAGAKAASLGLQHIAVADDGPEPTYFIMAGFDCKGWPKPRPQGIQYLPSAFDCVRKAKK